MFFSSILPYLFLLILRIYTELTAVGEGHHPRRGRQNTTVEGSHPGGALTSIGDDPQRQGSTNQGHGGATPAGEDSTRQLRKTTTVGEHQRQRGARTTVKEHSGRQGNTKDDCRYVSLVFSIFFFTLVMIFDVNDRQERNRQRGTNEGGNSTICDCVGGPTTMKRRTTVKGRTMTGQQNDDRTRKRQRAITTTHDGNDVRAT